MADERPHLEQAVALVDLATKASTAYGRPDLAERLTTTRSRLEQPGVSVLVIGEFKQGKSTLINALLNVDVCPTDDDIATAVPTVARYGADTTAVALWDAPAADADADADAEAEADGDVLVAAPPQPDREVVAIDAVPDLVTAAEAEAGDDRRLRAVEITVPRKLLQAGLTLVDTPGVGGLQSAHGAATMGALATAEAVLFVSDASQEITQSELDLLQRTAALTDHVVFALTKTDIHPHWPDIAELNRAHLERAGLAIDILPLSSVLRHHAVARSDQEMNVESGYPALQRFLRDGVLAKADHIAAQIAADEVDHVIAQLRAEFVAEKTVLEDPARAEEQTAALAEAKERAEALRTGAARWQTTLNDGIQDLNGDVDFDLRERIRGVNELVDERFAEEDPAETWDEFDPWLRQFVATEVAENYQFLCDRADDLASRVASLFLLDEEGTGVTIDLARPTSLVEAVEVGSLEEAGKKPDKISQGLGALRGSYGGMMMFGMLGGMVGVTMVLPVTLGLGAAMGVKQLRDDKKRQVTQRRQQARQVARKYVDAVNFSVSKDSRDTLRRVHRELRDDYASRAQELVASAQAALQAAERAAGSSTEEGQRRLADIDAELGRLDGVTERIDAVRASVAS